MATTVSRRPEQATGSPVLTVGSSHLAVELDPQRVAQIRAQLAEVGISTPGVMAERALAGVDLEREAKQARATTLELAAMYQSAIDELDPAVRSAIERAIAHPKGKGQLDRADSSQLAIIRELGGDEIRMVTAEEIGRWLVVNPFHLLHEGPYASVDHRPYLGPTRNQGGRGTCTSFSSTAVAEALEFLRDGRGGPRDLSEELVFWYSKKGQIWTAGGYDVGVALRHYCEYGSSEEIYFPYWGTELASNHAQVPAPDDAMDRAHFYTSDEVVALPIDTATVKDVLRSGRCVSICHDTDNWHTGTGLISFPDPPDSLGRGGGHATAIIGFIDRDDLPALCEGGYFIVRNSWGGYGSASNVLGPEYGGHLLMPYGWFRRYVSAVFTFADLRHDLRTGTPWLQEYYRNASLEGAPTSIAVPSALYETHGTVAEQEVDQVDFNWGSGGPFHLHSKLSPLLDIDLGPSDFFSARWTQVRRFREGWYRFRLTGDDGVRLWVDDRLVINAWWPEAATEHDEVHYLQGGDHILRVEYFERTGAASVNLHVEPLVWHYELFPNDDLSGSPTSLDDTLTDLEWRHAPPVWAPLHTGVFSLRTSATMPFETGSYSFNAVHTGGCRIYVDGTLALDAWTAGPGSASGTPVSLTAGTHHIVVEFKHTDAVPPLGSHAYYRAALRFSWADTHWRASFYHDNARKQISDAHWPNVDSQYEAFRTQGLSGHPVWVHNYDASHTTANQYQATDGIPLRLVFPHLSYFTEGIAGAPTLQEDWLSAHIRRRIFLPERGRYVFAMATDDGYRLVVDGKELLQDQHVVGADPFNAEVELQAGVHDLSLEYENTRWGGRLGFSMDHAVWNVDYFADTALNTPAGSTQVERVADVITQRPPSLAGSYSARMRRMIWLPLGRYRVQVRADDGVRLKVAGVPLIDAWTDEAPTSYHAFFEHRGGNVPFEIEYYQHWGGAELDFELVPEGFFGEYYHGRRLEEALPGSDLDRNVPDAYRFENALDFDWGQSGPLPRIGSDNFSARWSGPLDLPVGRWSIELDSDDGVRAFLDGRLIIDAWHDEPLTPHARLVDLVGRKHDLRVEFYEHTGAAACKLKLKRVY